MNHVLPIVLVILLAGDVFAQESSPTLAPSDSVQVEPPNDRVATDQDQVNLEQLKKSLAKKLTTKQDKVDSSDSRYSMPIIGNKMPTLEERIAALEQRLTEIEERLK